jgi:hypothetical protein
MKLLYSPLFYLALFSVKNLFLVNICVEFFFLSCDQTMKIQRAIHVLYFYICFYLSRFSEILSLNFLDLSS